MAVEFVYNWAYYTIQAVKQYRRKVLPPLPIPPPPGRKLGGGGRGNRFHLGHSSCGYSIGLHATCTSGSQSSWDFKDTEQLDKQTVKDQLNEHGTGYCCIYKSWSKTIKTPPPPPPKKGSFSPKTQTHGWDFKAAGMVKQLGMITRETTVVSQTGVWFSITCLLY